MTSEPKDLGLKLASKEEAFWTKTQEMAEQAILQNKREIEINETIMQHAKTRALQEKNK